MDYLLTRKNNLLAQLAGIDTLAAMYADQGRKEDHQMLTEKRREVCEELDAVEGALSIKN